MLFSLLYFALILLCCPFAGATSCQPISEEVLKICPFYNFTAPEDKLQHIAHINRNKVILDFLPLFTARCSSLSRILICSTLFPFCSANYILMPCKNICVSVKADCHRTFMLHRREWPEYLNCSSFPSAPDLCLSPSSSPSSRNSSFTTPSPSNHSRPTITASFLVISLAPLFLLLLVFAFFFLRYLFCFHEAPQINRTNAIRYAAPPPSQAISLQSWPRENSEPPTPPSATPPPPPLPPKRRHQTETLYENSNLYAITKLNF